MSGYFSRSISSFELSHLGVNMSGLRSIADWALGGGAGASNDDDLPPVEGPSEDELRAKRMARLAALETTSRSNSAPKSDDTSANVDNIVVEYNPPRRKYQRLLIETSTHPKRCTGDRP